MSAAELQQRPVALADDLGAVSAVRLALIAVGAALLLLFVASVVVGQTHGGETKKTAPNTVSKTETTTTTTTGPKTAPTKTTSTKTTTTTPPSASKEVTKTAPAEGVLLALLGSGLVLILAGGLYSRITAIKLPGGVELTLSKEEGKQLEQSVVEKAKPGATPGELALATVAAFELARTRKRAAGEPLEAQAIDQAALGGLHKTNVAIK